MGRTETAVWAHNGLSPAFALCCSGLHSHRALDSSRVKFSSLRAQREFWSIQGPSPPVYKEAHPKQAFSMSSSDFNNTENHECHWSLTPGQNRVCSSLSFACPHPRNPHRPAGADVLEPAANLLPWLWLHWFGGFGVLPQVPTMVGAREVLGSQRDLKAGVLGVCVNGILHWCSSGSAQLLGLSVSDGDQQDLLLPVKTVPFLCKPVSPQPQLSLTARTCLWGHCGEPQSREPQLGAQDRGDVGTQGGLGWCLWGQLEREVEGS